MTKSGITYDREEILQHFNKVGYFDPFTREPLTEKGLFPNRALKECLDKFVEENGWCVDF